MKIKIKHECKKNIPEIRVNTLENSNLDVRNDQEFRVTETRIYN